MVGLKEGGAALTVWMLTMKTMVATAVSIVTVSRAPGFPRDTPEASSLYLIRSEQDTDEISLQEHEGQFFMDTPRARGPGRHRKVSGCVSESVEVYLTAVKSPCNLCVKHH